MPCLPVTGPPLACPTTLAANEVWCPRNSPVPGAPGARNSPQLPPPRPPGRVRFVGTYRVSRRGRAEFRVTLNRLAQGARPQGVPKWGSVEVAGRRSFQQFAIITIDLSQPVNYDGFRSDPHGDGPCEYFPVSHSGISGRPATTPCREISVCVTPDHRACGLGELRLDQADVRIGGPGRQLPGLRRRQQSIPSDQPDRL